MKKIIVFILSLTLLLAAALPAAGASDEEYAAAWQLYELGLFRGRGEDAEDFDLDSPAAREEAVIMLLRLTANEDNAEGYAPECRFTDVSDWAKPYVAYAAHRGFVNGRGETFFDARSNISVTEYLTMVLRALGYRSEPGELYGEFRDKDFDWDAAWLKSDEIGLTHGEYGADTEVFTRGNMAVVSAAALGCAMNAYGGATLFELVDWEGGLREARNVESFTVERYAGGETAYAAPALRLMTEEFAGERQTYVHMDDLYLLLAAAAGTLEVSEDGGVSAPYTQEDGRGERFTRDYGAFLVKQDIVGVGMQVFSRDLIISMGEERALTVSEYPRPEGLWRLHFNGGARHFYTNTPGTGYGYVQYVNAGDVLAYFGFDLDLSVRGEAEEAAWSLAGG